MIQFYFAATFKPFFQKRAVSLIFLLFGIFNSAQAVAPIARTVSANRVTYTSAILNALVNANSLSTTISFEYGLTTAYGSSISIPGTLLGAADSFRKVNLTNLMAHKVYHFRVVASNTSGTTNGEDRTFITGGVSSSNNGRGNHTLIVDSAGVVYAFGANASGQLGDATTVQKPKPIRVLKGNYPGTTYLGDNPSNPIIAVASGSSHSLALAADGTVWAWGYNGEGQLGDGTIVNKSTPVKVVKGLYAGTTYLGDNAANPIIGISAGLWLSAALGADGKIYTFGFNANGQLGNSSVLSSATPVISLKGAYSGATYLGDNVTNPIIAMNCGSSHMMALAADGQVFTYGYNATGQLGDGSLSSKSTPVKPLKGVYAGTTYLGDDPSNPIVAISTHGYTCSALSEQDGFFTFGANTGGQIGDGSFLNRTSPVRVIKGAYAGTSFLGDNPANPILSFCAGPRHTLVLTSDGALYSFGSNGVGQLGDGTTTSRNSPVRVLKGAYAGTTYLGDNPSNPIVAIMGSDSFTGGTIAHSMIITADGNLYSFGYNANGQLGDNSFTNRLQPVRVQHVGAAGFLNVLESTRPSAKTVIANRITFTSANLNGIVNANSFTTTISFEYGLTNAYGSTKSVPGSISGTNDQFIKVNLTGLLPHQTYYYRIKAVNSKGTTYGAEMTFISGGSSYGHSTTSYSHNIVLDSNGIVYTMGQNLVGQLGDGTSTLRRVPVRVLKGAYSGTKYLGDNPANPIVAVAAGDFHSLALAADGTVYSFGYNINGQLGDGTTTTRNLPVRVLKGSQYTGTTYLGDNLTNPMIAISCGADNSMILAANGAVYAFGDNTYGQLGDSTTLDRLTPIRVKKGEYLGTNFIGDNPINPVVSITSGTYSSLILTADGVVHGLGYNAFGQLGDSSTSPAHTPVKSLKGIYNGNQFLGDNLVNPIVKVINTIYHSLCLAYDGTVYSMGYNTYGQLGNGTSTNSITPIKVIKGAYSGTTYLGDNPTNPVVSIFGGSLSSYALMKNGTLFSFGINYYGNLGDGTTIDRFSPVAVVKGDYDGISNLGDSISNPIVSVSGSAYTAIAIAKDGYLYSFGYNATGQIGDNSFLNKSVPTQMRGVGMNGYLNVLQNSLAPTAKTVPANRITFTSASLNALVNPNTVSTAVSFEYGLTNAYGSIANVSGTFTGGDDTFLRANITNLIPHRTYYYRVKAVNAYGTNYGSEMTFIPGSKSSNTSATSYSNNNITLDSNGIVYTTGYNAYGQLGDGTHITRKVPVRVLKGAYSGTKYLGDNPSNPIIAVASGLYHSLALAADGTIYSFGFNGYGQLGDGTTASKNLPVRVFKGAQYTGTSFLGDNPANRIIAISCGGYFSAALAANGVLYMFGYNGNGELGDSTFTTRSLPVRTKRGMYSGTNFLGDDLNNPIISIASGDKHSLALAADGMVYGFGYNAYGQLGDNTTTTRNTPIMILKGNYNGIANMGDDVSNPIVKAKAAGAHSICLAKDGTIYTMGSNVSGQLGDGTTTNRLTPIRVLKGAYAGTTYLGDDVNNPIQDINGAYYDCIALTQNGRLFSWGYNTYGGLGDGTSTDRVLPVAVLKGAYGGTTNLGDSTNNQIVSISSGLSHHTAITQNGYVFSFGSNTFGELGNNTFTHQNLPSQMRGVGLNGNLNVLQNSLAPSARTVPANRITFTSASLNALINPNTVSTTVSFEYGLTNAYGSIANVSGTFTGGDDTFLRANITNLIPHRTYYYRIKAVNSYGTNYGQEMTFTTGSNSSSANSAPGQSFTIILDSNGIVYTVGSNSSGQLGDGTFINKKVPIRVLKGAYAGTKYLGDNPSNPIIAVASGGLHALALAANGTIYSFGYNGYGQLGDGTATARLLPVRVLKGAQYAGTTFLGDNPANKIIAISCGKYYSSAIAESGIVYSFGYNGNGELGDSTFTNRSLPVRTKRGVYSGTNFLGDDLNNPIISMSSGEYHTLALAADGMVYGFGYNLYGQLGDGTTTNRNTPVLALKGDYNGVTYLGDDVSNPIVKAKASGLHSVCLANDGTIYSMGYNGYGQLGDGTTTNRSTPVRTLKGAYTGTTYLGDDVNNPIKDINLGNYNSTVLTQDGKLFSWGYNGYGNIGDGTTTDRTLPVAVLKGAYGGSVFLGDSVDNPIVSILSGLYYQTAITQNGYIFSFGYNNLGQLGNNTLSNQALPSQMRGVGLSGNLNVLQNSLAPEVHTIPANQITFTGAALNCLVNANTVSTTVSFEFGLTKAYGSVVNISGSLTGGEDSFRTALITGLTPHKTYHYRVKATNAYGTIYGEDMSFITGGASSSYSSVGEHTIILDSSGIVYASGYNGYGQLGEGTATNRTTPIKVLKGAYPGTTYLGDNPANPIVAVATGYFHSVALAKDGSVYTFGYNFFGQLGNGTVTNSATPVKALSISNAQAIAANSYSTYVLLKDGSVYSFGYNSFGHLGDSTTTSRTTAVRMKKGFYPGTSFIGDDVNNPIIKISAGGYHFIAMAADGKVYSVGYNAYGELGDNSTTDRFVPVSMVKGQYNGNAYLGDDISNPIIAIASGLNSSLALDANGLVYSTGYNSAGQLGDGTMINRSTPVKALEGAYNGTTYLGDNSTNPIVSIASGSYHSIALDANGLAYTFGYNVNGQLGDSSTTNRLLPTKVNQGQYSGSAYLGGKSSNPIVSISAGLNHSIGISADGYVLGVGKNDFGQLGNGTIINKSTPTYIKGVGNIGYLNVLRNEQAPDARTAPANRITYTSARLNGLVNANVLNTTVRFEYGLTTAYGSVVNIPATLSGNVDTFISAAITGLIPHQIYHYRIRAINLKDTTYSRDMVFVTGGKSSSNSSVASHQIFVDSAGIVFTVGSNSNGQLGDGTTTLRQVPIRVLKGAYAGTTYLGDNPANPIIAVAAGYNSSIALAADGTVYTFGMNTEGQLGDGTTISKSLPVKVLKGTYVGTTYLGDNANNPIISIVSGANHCNALALDGTAYSFGYNIYGQLGDGSTIQRALPVRVLKGMYDGNIYLGDNKSNPLVALASNGYHTMALTSNGQVYAFGYNIHGQLGDSTTTHRHTPIKVLKGEYAGAMYLGDSSLNPIVALSVGGYFSTALDANGKVYAFGQNNFGQLGDGTIAKKIVPKMVLKGSYAGTSYLGDDINDPILSISSGVYHNIALSLKGEVYSFGYNSVGQLGDNTMVNRITPVKMNKGAYAGTLFIGDNSSNKVVSLSTGEYSSSVITEDGYVYSVGRNNNGQLGDNTLFQRNTPALTHGVNDSLYLNVLRNIKLPTARTVLATRITYTSATINCVVNTSIFSSSVAFEYGTSNAYGTETVVAAALSGNSNSFLKLNLTGLTPHQTYHYRVRVINVLDTFYGADMIFTTGSTSSLSSTGGNHAIILDSSGIVYTYGSNDDQELGDGTSIQRKTPIKVLKGAYNGTQFLGDNPLNPIIAVTSGIVHNLALAADGTVYTFGFNANGQLGDNTVLTRNIPVKVLKGNYAGTTFLGDNPANPIIAIQAGRFHSSALAANGTVYNWGDNANGQLGDSTTVNKLSPVNVLKGVYNGVNYLGDDIGNPIVAISCGSYHSMAIDANGLVYSYGANSTAQLGIGIAAQRTTPVNPVKGMYAGTTKLGDNPLNPIIAISGGITFSLVLAKDGSVYAFGNNAHGQLGEGSFGSSTSPQRVKKGAYPGINFLGDSVNNPIVSITTGEIHSMALTADGSVYTFGNNFRGQLGNGTLTNSNLPIKVLKGAYAGTSSLGDNASNPIVSITAGGYFSTAISKNGNVYSFGWNSVGQLGDGSNTNRSTPINVKAIDTNSQLNVLLNYILPTTRTVPANRITYTSANLNAQVNANGSGAIVSFEYGLTNAYGSSIIVPGILLGENDSFRSVNLTGLIPHRVYHYRVKASSIAGISYGRDLTFTTGSKSSSPAMSYSSLILDSNGIVYAYGNNSNGQLGDGTLTDRNLPIRVLKGAYNGTTYLGDNPANPIVAVSMGQYHALALDAAGVVYAFGANTSGQLGDSTIIQKTIPIKVKKGLYSGTEFLGDNPLNPIISIQAGSGSSMALAANGTMYSFGINSQGQLGDSSFVNRTTPVRVKKGAYAGTNFLGDNPSNPIIAFSNTGTSCIALAADGIPYSFGSNFSGQLGDGTLINKNMPVRILKGVYPGTTFMGDNVNNPIISLACGNSHALVLSSEGRVYSFGRNTDGALGNGNFTNSSLSVNILKGAYAGTTYLGDDTLNPAVSIAAGYYHSLVMTRDGSVFSFGENASNGQLGDGTLIPRNTPVRVLKGVYVGNSKLGDEVNNPIVSIIGGWFHSMAIAQDGFVYAWGQNSNGQLGDNTFTNKSVAAQTRGISNIGFLNVLNSSLKPSLAAVPANRITYTSAKLNTLFNPNNSTTSLRFEYGLTIAYGDTISIPGTFSGSLNLFRNASISGLIPHRTYHYRAIATNTYGTSYSEDRTFVTGSSSSLYSSSGNHTLILDSNGIVYAFGDNTYGQLGDSSTANRILPIRVKKGAYNGTTYLGDNPANPIIAVSAGENHSMALAADGTVFSFGLNTYGQLGIGSTFNRLIPTKVIKGAYTGTTYLGDNITNPMIAISCGASHTLALASDGTVFSFGYNSSGELGDNTITQRTIPTKVLKGAYNGSTYLGDNSNPMISIAASRYHSVALGADGMVYTFGRNAEGQLGDFSLINRLTPARVIKGQYIGITFIGDYYLNPITAIAANDYRTMLLAADGTVYSFGYNGNGQLGDNTTTNRNSPVRVLKGLYSGTAYLGDSVNNPIVSISLGTYHSSALAANGRVFNFGANFFGQLGDGTTTQSLQPLRALKGAYSGNNYLGSNNSNPIVSISNGNNHSIAIDQDGYVYAYGYNNQGQLGDSTLVNRTSPISVRSVSGVGRLNVFFNELIPVIQALPANRVTYTSAYLSALVNTQNVSTTISFEYGLSTSYSNSVQLSGSFSSNQMQRVSQYLCNLIPGKTYHFRTVATNAEGTVYGPDQTFVTGSSSNIYTGNGDHNLLVGSDGIVYSYGYNDFGQLGDSVGAFRTKPIKVYKGAYNGTKYLGDNPNNPIISVARGGYSSIALAADGTVYSFGENSTGSLGDNTTTDKMIPVKVLKGAYNGTTYLGDNPNNPIISLTMGYACSYALALDGTVYSFGWNNSGRLGDSTTTNRSVPIRVKKGAYTGTNYLGDNPSNPIVSISNGFNSFYAAAADGLVYAMGSNMVGQLGIGNSIDKWVPVKVLKGAYSGTTFLGDDANNPIVSVSGGSSFALALSKNGQVYSFGLNSGGQLGDSTIAPANIPVSVKKGAYVGTTFLGDNPTNPVLSISAGGAHSMALTANGELYAFGSNTKGQLGDSTTISKSTPIRVLKGIYSGANYLGDNSVNPIIGFSLSNEYSTVITRDGHVFGFGSNFNATLGDNTLINKSTAVKALDITGSGALDLIQCNSFSSIPTILSTTYTSQHSDTDATGWRHYCTVDNQLLLSLKIGASGAVVSDDSVRLKLAATTTMSSTSFGGMITNVNGYAIFERRWDVKPTTQPSSAVGIKYYFTPKEYSDLVVALANLPQPSTFTNVNQLTMYKATSGVPFADPHTVPGVLLKIGTVPNQLRWKYAPHGNCNHSAEYNVASFSGGGGGGGGGGDTTSALLPVELLSFKGQWSEDDAILTWVTASERNSDRFEVERSIDGINFTKVGTVKSKGNSTEVLTYMFNDIDAGQAKVDGYYYRLKQIDFDGEYDYTQIIYLSIDKKPIDAKVIVFPNPFVSELQVVMPTSSNSDVQIQIAGVQGAMIMNYMDKVDQDRRVKINTELLPAGVFILNITQDGITSSHKIIKE